MIRTNGTRRLFGRGAAMLMTVGLASPCLGQAAPAPPEPKAFSSDEKLIAQRADGLFCRDRDPVEMFIIAYYTHDNALLETLQACRVLPAGTPIAVIEDQTPQNGGERAHILNVRIVGDGTTGYAVSSGFRRASAPPIATPPPTAATTTSSAPATPPPAPGSPEASLTNAGPEPVPSRVEADASIPLPPRDPRRTPRRPAPMPPARPLDLTGEPSAAPEN